MKLAAMRLKRLAGVQDVKIDLKNGETEITSNRDVSAIEAEMVLTGSGYSVVKK